MSQDTILIHLWSNPTRPPRSGVSYDSSTPSTAWQALSFTHKSGWAIIVSNEATGLPSGVSRFVLA